MTFLVYDMGDIEEADLIGDKDKVEEACPVTQDPGQGQEGLPQPPGRTQILVREEISRRIVQIGLLGLV